MIHRNPYYHYGFDFLLRNLLFLLLFTPCGVVWSVDSLKSRCSGSVRKRNSLSLSWPLRLMQFQIGFVYLVAGCSKLVGTGWRSGEALGQILLHPYLGIPQLSIYFKSSIVLLFLRPITWMTLAFEIGFPLQVLFSKLRWPVFCFGIVLHIGTILFLHVGYFGYLMVATYICLIPPKVFEEWIWKSPIV